MNSRLAIFVTLLLSLASHSSAQEIVDTWKYTFSEPAADWKASEFDDSTWEDGEGGFGTRETPGARVGTPWTTKDIWLRKSFSLHELPEVPKLWLHHDEHAQVFINGRLVAEVEGFSKQYAALPISREKAATLQVGVNVVAVHCRQTVGGQFIDVHLIDGDNVPQLPRPARSRKPFATNLSTTWGEKVTPDNAWTEYPRPHFQREQWTNLNGSWDYAISSREQLTAPEVWGGKILVPFCLESKLGGGQYLLDASEALWYRRTFDAKRSDSELLKLNFEAVDYRCEVFVNGQSVGRHQGGNTPFSFDISSAIRDGRNELIVRVEDDTEAWQLRGKQSLNPSGIWYTQVSGIWQTVWLESVPINHINNLKITTNATDRTITVLTEIQGEGKVRLFVSDGDDVVAEATGGSEPITLQLASAKLWSPSSPHLYNIEATLVNSNGSTIDRVESYAGIRTVGKAKDADGHWRITLNGEILFHWGPLDQGWWPDGLLTPPSDEAMLFDIEFLKSAGFNMIRKHIKVEPRRYYYHCDRLGMLVWQDQVSGGSNQDGGWPKWTHLQSDPVDAKWPTQHHEQFMTELEAMIDLLESHPSIVVWTPFNEAWGQHQTVEVGNWTAKRDPSRLVNIASGGNFWPSGDMVDEHHYPHPGFPFDLNGEGRFDPFIKVVGEFGGHGLPVTKHIWDVNRNNWGYGDIPKSEAEYKERYITSINKLNDLRRKGIAAGVYTQTTDVEGEINGLMTYDRKVTKIPASELAKIHAQLYQEQP